MSSKSLSRLIFALSLLLFLTLSFANGVTCSVDDDCDIDDGDDDDDQNSCIPSTGVGCDCDDDEIPVLINSVAACVSRSEFYKEYSSGLIPSTSPSSNSLNLNFRHLSVGFLYSPDQSPSWNLSRQWNWLSESNSVISPIRDQRTCKACAAFSVTSAMGSALVISNPAMYPTAPVLSVQQFLDCGVESCNGGWTEDLFDYSSRMFLLTEAQYPYRAVESPSTCTASKLSQGRYRSTVYEKVSFPGTLGLIMAVMQQPAVVAVEASSAAFMTYRGGVFSNATCYSQGVDHTMLLVGYDLDASPPFWILRNSWGTNWGERGYMRMAMQGEDGVCGINVVPAYYPVVKDPFSSDPCNKWSLGNRRNQVQGRLNPCGGGTCQETSSSTYSCTCNPPFVVGTNSDGTQTCVPSSPCTFSPQNPCRLGTCLDSQTTPGAYTCLCPLGLSLGRTAGDSNPTCVPGTGQSPATYEVPPGFQVSCPLVQSAYGISKTRFSALNPAVNCSTGISGGTQLNVTSDLGNCTVPYVVPHGTTCDSISRSFLPFLFLPITGPGTANPDLDCDTLQAGQLICLARGPPPRNTVCTLPYNLETNDTCESIINNKLVGNKLLFYSLNPGINCDFLESVTNNIKTPNYKVCLRVQLLGTILSGCASGRIYTVRSGDSCYRILNLYFRGSSTRFRTLNRYSCSDSTLDVNDKICLP